MSRSRSEHNIVPIYPAYVLPFFRYIRPMSSLSSRENFPWIKKITTSKCKACQILPQGLPSHSSISSVNHPYQNQLALHQMQLQLVTASGLYRTFMISSSFVSTSHLLQEFPPRCASFSNIVNNEVILPHS